MSSTASLLLALLAAVCGCEADVYTVGAVRCRFESCDVDDEVCCEPYGGDGSGQQPRCGAPGSCAWLERACDGPEDCAAGQVCRGTNRVPGDGSTPPVARCTAVAECTTARSCHTSDDCATVDEACCAGPNSTDGICGERCR